MAPIFEYMDYRKYILDFYKEQKSCSAFTWREFAQKAGFKNPVYLKQITEGQYNLSPNAVGKVAVAMKLVGFEVDYFKLLVSFAKAKSFSSKRKIFDEIREFARENKVTTLDEGLYQYFSSWKYPLIREMASAMRSPLPRDIAKRSLGRLDESDVEEILSFLTNRGLLQRDKRGNYHQTHKSLSMINEAMPIAAREMQREMGNFALKALEFMPLTERNMSGLTMGISRKTYEQIFEEIADFRKRLMTIITSADDAVEKVYRLNLQFFPLTRNLNNDERDD